MQLASSGMYSKAWETLSEGVEDELDLADAQTELAMQWLRNVRISPGQKEQTFSEIVNKVVPVLHRAVDTTNRAHAATVTAHIGWAGYLLFREGNRGVKIDEHFLHSLRLDSINVFANAMYGFWLLYPGHNGGTINEANRYFSIASKNDTERSFVRTLIFAAYRNVQRPDYQAQIIRFVNELRENNEELDLAERKNILSGAYHMYRGEIFDEVEKLITAQEHLATFEYLTRGIEINSVSYLKDAITRLKAAAERR